MQFRQASHQDVALVTTLTRTAFAPWVPVIGRNPLPMETDYAQAILRHRIDILENPSPVGLIEMIPTADHLWIENICVHPDHQGQGLGCRLIAHAETVAQSLKLTELRLLTNAAFTANLRFYARQGFTQSDRRPFKEGFTVYFRKSV